jgi:hypothetical protein
MLLLRCLQEQKWTLFLCCCFYKKDYILVYALFFPACSSLYIVQTHRPFTLFTFEFLRCCQFFSFAVDIVFRLSTQNPWLMSLYKSEYEDSLCPSCRCKPQRLTAPQTALHRMSCNKNLYSVFSLSCH